MTLREWRKLNKLSGQVFADKIGMSVEALLSYERGTRRPRPEIAQRIETATNGEVAAAELLGISGATKVREDPASFTPEPTISVPIPSRLLNLATEQKLDVSALIAEGGVTGLRDAVKQRFTEDNKAGIEWSRDYVNEHGTPAEQAGLVKREAF